MKALVKLKSQRDQLQAQVKRLEKLSQDERDMDWFDDWSYLQTQIDRLTRLIQQEESWQAKSH